MNQAGATGQGPRISGKELSRAPPGARFHTKRWFLGEPAGGSLHPGTGLQGKALPAGQLQASPWGRRIAASHTRLLTSLPSRRNPKDTPAESWGTRKDRKLDKRKESGGGVGLRRRAGHGAEKVANSSPSPWSEAQATGFDQNKTTLTRVRYSKTSEELAAASGLGLSPQLAELLGVGGGGVEPCLG